MTFHLSAFTLMTKTFQQLITFLWYTIPWLVGDKYYVVTSLESPSVWVNQQLSHHSNLEHSPIPM